MKCFVFPFVVGAQLGLFRRLLFGPSRDWKLPRGVGSDFKYSYLSPRQLRRPRDKELFDYIVIGGGGAGCPLARTLAENGYKTLLVERGDLRENHPKSWTIDGNGATLMDGRISIPSVTTEGYVIHNARVLGGGTAINLGFYIEDDDASFKGIFKDQNLWEEATLWVRNRTAHRTHQKRGYSQAIREFAEALTGRESLSYKPYLTVGRTWKGMSTFETESGFRTSADTLLGPIAEFPDNLVLSVNTTAVRVDIDPATLQAQCVLLTPSLFDEHPTLGRRESIVGSLQNAQAFHSWLSWYPNIARFFAGVFTGGSGRREGSEVRACLNTNSRSEIILSAGALNSAPLLYHSGVGPLDITNKLGVKNIIDIPDLGDHLGDRVFIPMAFYFKPRATNATEPAVVENIALFNASLPLDAEDVFRLMETTKAKRGVSAMARLNSLLEMDRYSGSCSPGDAWFDSNSVCTPEQVGDEVGKLEAAAWPEAQVERAAGARANVQPDVQHTQAHAQAHTQAHTRVPGAGGTYMAGFEEVSGGEMTTGCALATRYFLPPGLRSSVITDIATETLYGCSMRLHEDGVSHELLDLCPVLQSVLDCFHAAGALVYIMPLPQAQGKLLVGGPDNKSIVVSPAYFSNPYDIDAAAAGVGKILRTLRDTDAFDDIFEEGGNNNDPGLCPAIVRNQLSALLQRVTTLLGPYVSFQEAAEVDQAMGHGWVSDSQTPEEFLFSASKQKYSSFPPILPDPDDAEELRQFVTKSSSTMWHFHGTAQIGKVVNDDFSVKGIARLSIVDGGALPRLPKMNPQIVIMAMGRYAALLKLQARQ